MNLPFLKKPAEKRKLTEEEEIEASAAPLLDHLTELRRRLIVCVAAIAVAFILCFFLSRRIFDFLIIPFVVAVGPGADGKDPTLYFAPLEFFFTQVRLAVFGGIALAFPVIAYELYRFIAPGLYRRERNALTPFLIASPALFAAGAALVYFFMMPMLMRFAVGFEAGGEGAPAEFQLLTRVGDYLSLITTLMLGFGVAFQMPVVLTLMARAGLVTSAFLAKNRRFAIVLIFIAAAILTPPDPLSQIVLASMLMALYEASVFAVRLAEKKAMPEKDEAAA
ncbi:MAG: twin-arginine translocase subunit TatC [Parvularculaceae bacterium]|nr:twin-arginine translocase subunit TatC [Parvularculaceae bacterium]